jgi:hypothetical protein
VDVKVDSTHENLCWWTTSALDRVEGREVPRTLRSIDIALRLTNVSSTCTQHFLMSNGPRMFLVTTAWRVVGLWMEEAASKCGG